VIAVSIFKIFLAVLFVGGERKAGKALLLFFYPLRLIFYYNPFSMYNQPQEIIKQEDTPLNLEFDELLAFNNAAKLRKCY